MFSRLFSAFFVSGPFLDIACLSTVGDPVTPGMPLATLYATGVTDFSAAAVRVRGAMPIGEAQPRVQPLLRQVIDTEGTAG